MRRLLLPLLLACCVPDGALADALVGRWEMVSVVCEGTADLSAAVNPAGDRYIVFHDDGTFEAGGQPHGRHTGRWTLDESTQELHLDSDGGEGGASPWIVTLDAHTMRWQRQGTAGPCTITHLRSA